MSKQVIRIIIIAMIILLALPVLIAPAFSAELPDGAQVFESTCAGCHVNGGNIIRRGKNLKQRAMEKYGFTSVENITEIINNGKGSMSAYGDRLTAEETQAVSEYVLTQSQKNWKN
ncbi:cytochrome c class I [[Leptolyngbya] sp. PCC 7376]|uniref:c-type cytochrome n=1 Tax=[Leptolyngbya] sp. PCC 7376 TaxID=111781 RepID=UPI00029F3442|nr:c-type cytochrome [[Leptolyngbya] sp. PCC 7376]AFY38096.1 cytochrome c class I [[Leptolyngbya] sp. PCC 7376]